MGGPSVAVLRTHQRSDAPKLAVSMRYEVAQRTTRHQSVTNVFHTQTGAPDGFAVRRAFDMASVADTLSNGARLLAIGVSAAAFGLTAGCALDTRTLAEGVASQPGASGDSSGAGGDSSQPNPGQNNQPPIDIPICTYSSATVASGCDTLAANPGFGNDTKGWQEEPIAMQIAWAADDASQDPSSGSIVVTNALDGANEGLATGAGMQCLPAKPGTTYVMAGDVFIPPDQDVGLMDGGPYVGRAGLGILFWRGKGCLDTMPTLGGAVSELVSDTGKWIHVEGSAVAPDGIESMSIRALTVKDFREFRFKAMFDNVLLQAR